MSLSSDLFLLPFAGSAPITRVPANIPSHPCLLPSLSLAPPPLRGMPTFLTPEFSDQLGGLALEESLKTVKGLALAVQVKNELIDEGRRVEADPLSQNNLSELHSMGVFKYINTV
jgi:hypothetical protein